MERTYMGFAQGDITPTIPVELVGYSRPDNISRGVLHRLIAQALVWKTKEEKCCLIAIDSIGFTVELSNKLRNQVADVLKISSDKVMLCFSHTHSAPNAGTNKEYFSFVCREVLKIVKTADKFMVPIKVGWGIANNEVGVNRRGCEASFDNRLGVLKITGTDAEDLKVILLRVSAHANVITADNYFISSDYFGVARKLLEEKYGCNVVLIQGASGDIRPRFRQENADLLEIHPTEAAKQQFSKSMQETYFSQSLHSLKKMANSIYTSVNTVIPELIPQSIDTLSMFSVERPYYADVPATARAKEIAKEAEIEAGIDGTSWINEVGRLNRNKIKSQCSNIEIQYLIINNGCICGIPNEVMSNIANEIVRKSNCPLLFFNGYTNGCSSYLPTAEEYDKGGFEVLWANLLYYQYHGRVMPFNRDTAKRLEDDVVHYWKNADVIKS